MPKNNAKTDHGTEVPLDQRISFRLQRIGTLLTTQAMHILKRSGDLTLNHWRLLTFLSERDSGSVQELAKLGYVDKATISRAAADLTRRGFIETHQNTQDRRSTLLRLTKAGEAALLVAAPRMRARQAALLDALTPQDRDTLFRILDTLEDTIIKKDQNPE